MLGLIDSVRGVAAVVLGDNLAVEDDPASGVSAADDHLQEVDSLGAVSGIGVCSDTGASITAPGPRYSTRAQRAAGFRAMLRC
jgi:hypothetical protein